MIHTIEILATSYNSKSFNTPSYINGIAENHKISKILQRVSYIVKALYLPGHAKSNRGSILSKNSSMMNPADSNDGTNMIGK